MKVQNIDEDSLKEIVLSILSKYLSIDDYNVFIFGSRASKGGSDRSDIDIGIQGDKPIQDRIMAAVRDEFEELNILYKFDIVDFSQVSEEFRDIALNNIININSCRN